ncbi:baseplate protein [Heliobacterium gestii]|uniref:Baseplate protein n=1 Tax=Heliomicrobium gestii TaxID=2699 RepID=A0A845LN44_HELGE|nr:GPW/gp25 family protein [Heliomicrobium gestii]MBM7868040.1 phage baseplate assembly protein W [Heliomicrobium gestii]MZP44306.1 baseplate protein [Heliomicrobium gestii]
MTQFLGRGWKFPIQVDPATGRIRMSEYEEDVEEAIRIILRTAKGERVMQPEFGCKIRDYVFRGTDRSTLQLMADEIKDALRSWEPRIEDIEVKVTRHPDEGGTLFIHIQYVVRRTNNLFNRVYPFYLYEGTG